VLIGPVPLAELAVHPGVTGLAIGVFDGVHLGHQAVVRSLPHPAAALTFSPHPLAVIAPQRVPARLTSLDQRSRYLRQLGAVALVAVRFDETLRELSAAAFVDRIATIFPDLRHLAIGEGWTFGRNREGDANRLAQLARAHGCEVRAIGPVLLDDAPVSSTRIREAILHRDFALAQRLLGRSHAVTGVVAKGDGRGRQIGFPTANLEGVEQLLPPAGVYAARVRIDGEAALHPAVLNLGSRPTISTDGRRTLEVHLLDFAGDLYGRELEVSNFVFLRNEQKFDGLDALKAQIARDVARARSLPEGKF
jgi:riboflavin kinase/FMN adenylyltransferase